MHMLDPRSRAACRRKVLEERLVLVDRAHSYLAPVVRSHIDGSVVIVFDAVGDLDPRRHVACGVGDVIELPCERRGEAVLEPESKSLKVSCETDQITNGEY